ncbi:MAG TPA: phospholipase D family protein [Opitutus sp.]|nr:phospholipase D family protein [Opitutus sp.]
MAIGFVTLAVAATVAAGRGAAFADSPFGAAVARVATAGKDDAKGNEVALLSGGRDALVARIHLIRHARRSIDVQTFIWTNDEVGRLVMWELIAAARRGVQVRIVADQMFSEQDPDVVAFLATVSPNLRIKHYRPALARIKPSLADTLVASVTSFHGVNQRMHSKVMVFDDAVLITGGRNLENGYYDQSTGLNYRDRDVLVVGPVVREAVKEFEAFWSYRHAVASGDLVDVAAAVAAGRFRRYDTRDDYDFGPWLGALADEADDAALVMRRFVARLRPVAAARFISDEPGKARGWFFGKAARITRELKRTIEDAETSVVMQTPYLVLSNPARDVIRAMEKKHPALRIRVSTNSLASTDNLIAYSANYRLRNRYVEDLKLEIHEFRPRPAELAELFPGEPELAALARERIAAGRQRRLPFLCIHAKSLVVDDRVAFVGSYNLDPRSESLNTEVGLLVEDEAFARELHGEIEADMRPENSWVIARRELPLGLDTLNGLIGGLLSLSPIDIWPIQNTSSFELRPGGRVVPPEDPAFPANYRDVGAFPGMEGEFSTKEILTRLYKAVGAPLTPIL